MTNRMWVFIILSIFVYSSCDDKTNNTVDTAQLELTLKATYKGAPLVIEESDQSSYEYQNQPIRFSKVTFYLSNISIGNADGITELSEIQFIDFGETHNTLESAMQGNLVQFGSVPVGTYSTVEFGVGVPADLNRTSPADYSANHPLGANNSSEYREAWNSYIFLKVEGVYDFNNNGFDENDIAFAYHAGEDEVFQNIEIAQNRSLAADEMVNITLELDVYQLFLQPNGDPLDLEPYDPDNQKAEARIIMNNFDKAIAVK